MKHLAVRQGQTTPPVACVAGGIVGAKTLFRVRLLYRQLRRLQHRELRALPWIPGRTEEAGNMQIPVVLMINVLKNNHM